ncbi:uncharacterized protein LOC100891398 isoform X2 [Strongylocentrotus purpuratus]|uniref:Interferon regulatory factor-3 domain-containing protein n=1 Tax=Strongylocentrotus purpuratus TaxID=7668 RepID=A0A7M7N5W5_STRPU|nr:uncharacterized protein LOC100891398 isoform X2 [Strongylocentrotus purpuratus]
MDAMEADSTKGAAFQLSPEYLALRSPSSDPMLSVMSPMAPQAHPVHVVSPDDDERIDSSLAESEPMRVNSEDVRVTLMADPNALRESLGSVELDGTRNASMQSNDHSQGHAASRMATQRQALPDSSQTLTSSGTSANGTTAKGEKYFTNYKMPEDHRFKVSFKFMSKLFLEKVVTKKGGCFLHYQPSDQPPIPVPAEVDRIQIAEQGGSLEEFLWVNEKQKLLTEKVLKSFHRGVKFYSREGNIYVKRSSDTKLFWQSTQQEPGIAIELNRNEETEVFNMDNFRETLTASVALGDYEKLRLPAIWFSFAQKWDRDSSPITTKLVWARVDPTLACVMVENVKPNVRSTESLESMHTSNFFFSHEARQSVPQ